MEMNYGMVQDLCKKIMERQRRPEMGIYGIPAGGVPPALMLANLWDVGILNAPIRGCLVIDDIVDSGETLLPYRTKGFQVDALLRKPWAPFDLAPHADLAQDWVKFPWENETGPESAVVRLLEYIGEDPNRDGLKETPARVLKAFSEITGGYSQDPGEILSKTFDVAFDEMIVLKNIRFFSTCEHHLLPFHGFATVGYIPTERVVGLSKLARLVECFARRLQVQERMTVQIAQAIEKELKPLGTGVVIKAKHLCMGCRGVSKETADMVTSSLLGVFRDQPQPRAEFLSLMVD